MKNIWQDKLQNAFPQEKRKIAKQKNVFDETLKIHPCTLMELRGTHYN